MLKPSRKILRKEIKSDPLLDTFEKIENHFDNNKKNLVNILIIFLVLIVGSVVFLNNKKESILESNSALGAALVAYSNLDYENAKFQFESVSASYDGTDSELIANYFLGKIAYEQNRFNDSEIFLTDFLENAENPMLVCGAIKLLVNILFDNKDFSKSFEILDKAKKFKLNRVSELELKLLEISAFLKINDFKNARNEIENILLIKNLPSHVKIKVDELAGML
tara:strand:- start:580 stop:1248 length:669 start_codon:yes stop_codon:yes gene_type:complete